MTEKETSQAAIYVVSTEEQAKEALNLANQQERCERYCEQRGFTVKIFVDAGASARSSDLPEFQKMLAYCNVKSNDVGFVVVQDLSRFARNQLDQGIAIGQRESSGVLLRST